MKQLFQAVVFLLAAVCAVAQTQPKGLDVNQKAPLFSGLDQDGKKISLDNLEAKGNVVLVFYRGQWCPYCNKQLKALEDSLTYITAKGATIVAVSPEVPENVNKTVDKTKATYSVISDNNLAIMKSYDVAYAVDNATIEKYKKYGIDFSKANGSNGANLPVPAVFIINKSGVIIYKSFNPDYTQRPSVKEILEHL